MGDANNEGKTCYGCRSDLRHSKQKWGATTGPIPDHQRTEKDGHNTRPGKKDMRGSTVTMGQKRQARVRKDLEHYKHSLSHRLSLEEQGQGQWGRIKG
jgi:hypothetical protein